MMHKVAMLTRRMAFLGSMKSLVSAASSGNISQASQKSRKKSQMSLYDKISRNFSLFDSSSMHSFSGAAAVRIRNSRQRSVSDVVKPQLEDLTVDCNGDLGESCEADIDVEASSISYMIEKRRLSTIDEDSPNPTLHSVKNGEVRNHIKVFFDSIEEEKAKEAEHSNDDNEVTDNSLEFSEPVFV